MQPEKQTAFQGNQQPCDEHPLLIPMQARDLVSLLLVAQTINNCNSYEKRQKLQSFHTCGLLNAVQQAALFHFFALEEGSFDADIPF